jgi:hypothetical protein
MNESAKTDKRRYFELTAVFITASGKFIFMDHLNQRLPFILSAIAFWVLYVLYRFRQDKSILKAWGFRKDNFKLV